MKTGLPVILLLFGCYLLKAQLPQYHAQVFGAEQGIVAGSITDVFKDRQQFVWITAGSKLQRFDGRNVYDHAFESHILQALCDRDNQIWVLSGQKIWRSQDSRMAFRAVIPDTSDGKPCAIFQLPGHPVCLLTTQGFFDWNEKTWAFRQHQTALPPAQFAPGNVRFDTCGTTIFYPGKGCYYAADFTTGQVKTMRTSTRFATFCAFTPDLAIISYYDGVSVWLDFKNGSVTKLDAVQCGLSKHLHNPNIMDAVPLGDSLFLVTTKFGACTYDLRRNKFVRQRIFAEGRPIELEEALLRLSLDKNGTFWAHNTTSVVAFNSLKNTIGLLRNNYDEQPHRWSNRVVGFAEDAGGNIWFGGFNGFNQLNLTSGVVKPHPPAEEDPKRLSHASVRGLAFDGRTLVLGPTLRGIWLYDPATDRYTRPKCTEAVRDAMEQEFVNGILPLRKGNFLVCGSPHQCLLETGSHRLRFLDIPTAFRNVNGACQAADGRVWLACGKAVLALDEQCYLLFSIPFDTENATTVFPCGRDSIWVGTNKGLWLLNPTSPSGKVIKLESPLNGTTIQQICQDGRGRFWFGTNDGLFMADAKLKLFRRFDFADNTQSRFFNPFSMFRARNRLLFLGGHNGINFFYPENIELEAPPLTVTLQTLTVGEGDSIIWNPHTGLEFSHDQNTLTFEVVAPYYNNAGKLQYRYRLHQDAPWINTNGSHLIRLAKLSPGKFHLEVAVSVAGTQWYGAAPLVFWIKPPFWKTPWFLMLAVGALGCLFWFFVRYRLNLLKKRQEQVLEWEKLKSIALQYELEAAAAKLQSLRLQMNPHFLFNALNSIQEMILTGNNDGAAGYLSKFSKLLRMVLAHSDNDFVSLREEIAMLRLYIELESLRFYDTFEYTVECAPDLDTDECKVPTLLIQPFVENAIWHGLLHKDGMRRLLVRFETNPDEMLICTIEDNGIGREAAQQSGSRGRHTGKGLNAGQERIQALNSRYKQHNSLEINDLKRADGVLSGTQVQIKLG